MAQTEPVPAYESSRYESPFHSRDVPPELKCCIRACPLAGVAEWRDRATVDSTPTLLHYDSRGIAVYTYDPSWRRCRSICPLEMARRLQGFLDTLLSKLKRS